MYCPYCGNQYPEGAKYCGICGKPVGTIIVREEKEDNTQWEICQIQVSITHKMLAFATAVDCCFWGEAIGVKGPYCAAKTEVFRQEFTFAWDPPLNPPMGSKPKDQEKSARLLDDLIRTLLADGWEALPERGTNVWAYKFKRRVKQK